METNKMWPLKTKPKITWVSAEVTDYYEGADERAGIPGVEAGDSIILQSDGT